MESTELLFKVQSTITSQKIQLPTIAEESILEILMATHSQATLIKITAYMVSTSALVAMRISFSTTTSMTPT